MNVTKDVSVVIPVFNAEKFIDRTLSSVALQTELPLEVIVVDDGSSDATCSVVEIFGNKNPQINLRLLRGEHGGPGHARNMGVNAAKGSWIAFLDSDDLWYPNKLLAISLAHRTSLESNILCHNELHRQLQGTESVLDYSKYFQPNVPLTQQLYKNNCLSTSAVICRRELILSCGGFDVFLSNAQDYELWIKMSPHLKIYFVKQVLGVYVDRAGNISSNRKWGKYKNVIRVLHRHRNKVKASVYLRAIIRVTASYIYRSIF